MDRDQPLITIGIPTFNRADLLKRAIESALGQDYRNIEVIVSDNASSDTTENLCRFFCDKDRRFKYARQPVNLGPTANFSETLRMASGRYFMWLGDDDWIDSSYVSACVGQLGADPTLALVYGTPRYYREGKPTHVGKVFDLLHDAWWRRVIAYYANVTDNGMFYGVMRAAQIRQVQTTNTMGGDWLLIAGIVSMGKARNISGVSVHRELGGTTASYRRIARSLQLPGFQAVFPISSIAVAACLDVATTGSAYRARPMIVRWVTAAIVFFAVAKNGAFAYMGAAVRRLRKMLA